MATLNGGRGWASDACAASVHRLDSAFGRILPINSAGRTYAEQAEAYRKYKNGGPLALPPGTSVHESGNAIDWHNSVWGILGLNAGLGWRGQPINRHGHRRTVSSETWHTEYAINEDNFRGQGGGFSQDTKNRQNWLNASRGEKLDEDGIEGPATKDAYKRYQIFLRDNGYGYTGAIDGDWGPGTQASHQRYFDSRQGGNWPANKLYGEAHVKNLQDLLNRAGYGPLAVDGQDGPATQAAVKRAQKDFGLAEDGVGGPITVNALTNKLTPAPIGRNATSRSTYDVQRKLIEKGYDLGAYGADGDYAAATTVAVAKFQKDNGLEPDGIYGPLTDEKLFASTPAPGPVDEQWPTNGRNATMRPTRDIQKLVGVEADDQYGPKTSVAVAKWQKANGLDADGIWGPASDAKGFPGIPLPDAPVSPGRDETYGKKIPTYPGATWADISPNKSVREDKIQFFVVHHAADTRSKQSQIDRFMTANDRNVSCNWFIGADGSASEIVPPDDYRAWTSGKFDHKAITVETQNTSGDPNWGISRESHERIADIAAWAADRYGLALDRKTIIGHREVPGAATACPGPSMDLEWIVARAKEIFAAKYAEQPEEPVITEPIPVGNEKIKAEIMDLLEQVARKVDSL